MTSRGGYYRMPHRIFQFRLTPVQFTVYSYLVSCTGQKEVCWPSYQTIAKACCISRNTAIRTIEALQKKRLIEKSRTTSRNIYGQVRTSNNEYQINDLSAIEYWSTEDTKAVNNVRQTRGKVRLDSYFKRKDTESL